MSLLKFIIFAYISFIIIQYIFTLLLRFYEKKNNPENYDNAKFNMKLIPHSLMELFISIISPLIALSKLSPKFWLIKSKNKNGVILIHGYTRAPLDMLPLALFLKRKNFGPIIITNFPTTKMTVEEMAMEIKNFFENKPDLKNLNWLVIGHSMGGIIGKCFLSKYKNINVNSFITIGSPHKGTKIGVFAKSKSVNEILPNSPLLDELNEVFPKLKIKSLALWSDFDQLILPSKNATMPEPSNNLALNYLQHLGFLYCINVYKSIYYFINKENQGNYS